MGTSAVTESKSNLGGCCWPGKRVLSYPETDDPLSGLYQAVPQAGAQQVQQLGDGAAPAQVQVQHGLTHHGDVAVGVDEPGQQGPPLQVDFHRVPVRQGQNLLLAAHRGDLPVLHQKPTGPLIIPVHGDNISVVIDRFRTYAHLPAFFL